MHITWSKGGGASVVTTDGDRINVLSTTPAAPGSRPEGTLQSGAELRVKVARCRREGPGFLIEGRLIDTTRDTRAEIRRLLGGGEGGEGGEHREGGGGAA